MVVYLIILILLIFLSYYSLAEHFTTRLAIHLSTFLLILTGAFIMQNIIRLVLVGWFRSDLYQNNIIDMRGWKGWRARRK